MESNQMTGAISKVGLQITNESPEFRERLDTFQDWRSSVVNKYSLVRAGFKFIGRLFYFCSSFSAIDSNKAMSLQTVNNRVLGKLNRLPFVNH